MWASLAGPAPPHRRPALETTGRALHPAGEAKEGVWKATVCGGGEEDLEEAMWPPRGHPWVP